MSTLTLENVIADFGQLPAAPEVVMNLLDYLKRDEVDHDVVAQMISRDPVLAAKSLRIANSSFYGMQRKVSTIHDCIVVLGLRTVTTMVTAMAVTGRFKNLTVENYDQRDFWLHSVVTALCARVLAGKTGFNPESAFTAGLIHDIGQLVLAIRFPTDFSEVIAYRIEHDCLLVDAEQEVLGFDHTQIGEALAQRWNFSAEIGDAVAGHHSPEDRTAKSLAGLVHLADIMAHVLTASEKGNALVPRLSAVAWNRLGLDWQMFKQLMAEVDAQRNDAEILFN